MKCQRCNRPMNKPVAAVHSRAGQFLYGPKCAAFMGILAAHKTVRIKRTAQTTADPAQRDLIEELECTVTQ